MKPLHTQLLPKKSTSSPSKISGSPPLISSWSRSSLMLLSEFLRWLLHEEREIPYQYQLQTSVFRRRVTSWAVIFQATNHYQNPFSFLNGEFFWILLCKITLALPRFLNDLGSWNVIGAFFFQLFRANSLRGIGFEIDFERRWARLIWILSGLPAIFLIKFRQP